MSERYDQLTTLAANELFDALRVAWRSQLGSEATRPALVLLVAQSALECGWWKACHSYNLGNQKASPAGSADFTYYGCDEVLSPAQAAHAIALDPTHCHVEHQDAQSVVVWFDPPHPYACFAAYDSLEDGAAAWLKLQHGRFGEAWGPLLSGDAKAFAAALKRAGYFTANLDRYTMTLVAVASQLDRTLPVFAEVEPDAGLPL